MAGSGWGGNVTMRIAKGVLVALVATVGLVTAPATAGAVGPCSATATRTITARRPRASPPRSAPTSA